MSDSPDQHEGLRARRRSLTERELEDAALDAFASSGFDVITMDQIAARAGVSVRTAFRYFPLKVDTVLFSARQVAQHLSEGLRNDLDELTSLIAMEDSIARSLSRLVDTDLALVLRLKRVRALMLTDDRLRAEVAKSEGYLAGMSEHLSVSTTAGLTGRLIAELTAATLRTAFDTWAATDGGGPELLTHYRNVRAVRDTLAAAH